MKQNVLVTGAGRGIGLETCRQLAEEGHTVFACPRTSSPQLDELAAAREGAVHVVPMDVTDDASIARATETVAARVGHLDVLFNNAGVAHRDESGLDRLDPDRLLHAYRVNAVGPLRVIAGFLPLLRRGSGKRLVQITSLMGSIADNGSGGSYGYRMSKAALNMAVRNLAHELGGEGFISVAVHPGWVRTRMGGDQAPLPVDEATREVLRVALGATRRDDGAFLGPGGKRLPW